MNDASVPAPTFGWRDDPGLNFGMTPRWVVAAARSYCWLYTYIAAASWGSGELEEPQQTIADELGVAVSTVYRAQKALVDAGALIVEATTTRGGDKGPNRYLLVWSDPSEISERRPSHMTGPGGQDRPEGPRGSDRSSSTRESEEPRQTIDTLESRISEWITENQEELPINLTEIANLLARYWCKLTGQVATKPVRASYIPAIQEWITAAGRIPTPAELDAWHARGLRVPGGWGFARTDDQDAGERSDWSNLS